MKLMPEADEIFLDLYSILGNGIRKIPFTFHFENIYQAIIDITELPGGIYMLRVSGSDKSGTKQFIKK